MSEPRTVVIMRHAKAEQDGPTDFERRLAPRGHSDAADAGRWLAERGISPDLALVSSAYRTHETWDAVRAAGGFSGAEVDFDRAWYAAGTDSALDLLRAVDGSVRSIVVVGHNPTMASLAAILDDGEGDPGASTSVVIDFPTSALAVFEYDGAWADLGEASARLVGYHVGRG